MVKTVDQWSFDTVLLYYKLYFQDAFDNMISSYLTPYKQEQLMHQCIVAFSNQNMELAFEIPLVFQTLSYPT